MRLPPFFKTKPRYARLAAFVCQECGFVRFQTVGSLNRKRPPDSGGALDEGAGSPKESDESDE
jgi:hypothetical protein